jgi:hypothetical protein
MAPTTLITIRESTAITGLVEGSTYNRVRNRTIPFIRKGGRLYFDPDELREWMRHLDPPLRPKPRAGKLAPRTSIQQALANQKRRKL